MSIQNLVTVRPAFIGIDADGNRHLLDDDQGDAICPSIVRDSSGGVVGLSASGVAVPTALPSENISETGSITFAGGDVMEILPSSLTGVTIYVHPSAGEIGVDYTGDATPNITTGNWVTVYGGNIATDESITISAFCTGIRFRPIASGAAADYIVLR